MYIYIYVLDTFSGGFMGVLWWSAVASSSHWQCLKRDMNDISKEAILMI